MTFELNAAVRRRGAAADAGPVLQRTCSCGGHTVDGGECESCRRERQGELLGNDRIGSARSLELADRRLFERRFGYDFARVRLHTDAEAATSAEHHGAQAYTVGRDVVFGRHAYRPAIERGRALLAHELAHVIQQSRGGGSQVGNAEEPALEREAESAAGLANVPGSEIRVRGQAPARLQRQQLGTRVTPPPGATSPFRKVDATFDGRNFVVQGDGTTILTVAGESGRPIGVRPGDATACGGAPSDSYLNNPRYVGITDNGPIPEGEYQFRVGRLVTFSGAEQAQMFLGGHYTDPSGASLHGGDWGAGRVALEKIRVLPGRRGCGNTATRSGFFLHGGVIPGSSGCIDIGNSGIDSVVRLLSAHRAPVRVRVRYTHPPPTVGGASRALGRFTYPGAEEPTLADRLKAVFDL